MNIDFANICTQCGKKFSLLYVYYGKAYCKEHIKDKNVHSVDTEQAVKVKKIDVL